MLPLLYPLAGGALLELVVPVVSLVLSVRLCQLRVCLRCCQLEEAIVVELPLVVLADSMDTR